MQPPQVRKQPSFSLSGTYYLHISIIIDFSISLKKKKKKKSFLHEDSTPLNLISRAQEIAFLTIDNEFRNFKLGN